jgi:hypothetical protein
MDDLTRRLRALPPDPWGGTPSAADPTSNLEWDLDDR